MRALARAETGDLPVLERLDYLPTRLFPARSQIVLISPDPISFEQRDLSVQPETETATRLAQIERALLLQRCRRSGVTVIDWPTELPFQQVAEAALSRPPMGLM